jgi:hypothetical protein
MTFLQSLSFLHGVLPAVYKDPQFQIASDGNRPEALIRNVEQEEINVTHLIERFIDSNAKI